MFLWSWVILSKNKECLHLYSRFLTFYLFKTTFRSILKFSSWSLSSLFLNILPPICLFLLFEHPIVCSYYDGENFFPHHIFFFMAYVFLFISFFNIIKIYTILTQQYDTNSIQVPIDGKLGNTKIYSGT